MALLTATQFKATEQPEPFLMSLGDGREVLVRRPDIPLLVFRGHLPTPIFASVIKLVGEWAGTATQDLTDDVVAQNEPLLQFIDLFVCEALVSPRAVRTDEERATVENAILVDEITLLTKRAILNGVMGEVQRRTLEVVANAQTFPSGGAGTGSGPDVPPVLATPV